MNSQKKKLGKPNLKLRSVEVAKRILTPLEFLASDFDFQKFGKNKVNFSDAKSQTKETKDWLITLLKANLYDFYKDSHWGWNEKGKSIELSSNDSRFLIVENEKGEKIAYCHIRFDMDYGRSVIYLYEIQVEETYRSQGIGSSLMSLVETFGKKAKMELLVLTCFKANTEAKRFFEKHGLTLDSTNPKEDENADYVIMSKKL